MPELTESPQWGLFVEGKMQPMPLDAILARIEEGAGKVQSNGGTERPDVILVTRPDSMRPVPAIECAELQAAILKRDESLFSNERRKSGQWFYPLLLIAIVATGVFHSVALLPAVLAMNFGASHAEAWRALHRLRADPQQYLSNGAAQIRYSIWLSMEGNKAWSRTLAIVALWVVVYLAQQFVPGQAGAALSGDIAAAGLIKNAVAIEPWRLFTASMMHGSILHILFNASAMLSLGSLLERGAHRHLVAPVWLVGAMVGSLFSWVATPITSVGASGGILAVFGFLLVMAHRCRSQLPPGFGASLVRSLVMIGMLGLLAWSVIDNAAHLGGFLAGAALAYLVLHASHDNLPLPNSLPMTLAGRIGEALVLALATFTLFKLLWR